MTAAGFVAVPQTWKAGGQSFQAASQVLAQAADKLCDELTAAGAAWGQGDLGRAFFNGGDGKPGFGATRNQWLPQIEDMVNVLGGTGDAMVTSGANYARAEQASTIGRAKASEYGPAAAGSSYRLPPFTGGMAVSDPPPGELMQMLDLVESLVAGCSWPDGSTGGMGQIRDALSAMATAIGGVITDVGRATAHVTDNNSGQAAENFATFARVVVQGLEQLQEACQGMSGSADNLRRQIDAARIQFVAGLVFLAASFIAAQALAPFTLFGSEAAFAATAEAEAQALRAFLMMLARGVIEGLWYSAGMDAIGQLSRMVTGLQKGFSVGELAKAGGEGALAGLVMGGLGAGARLGAGRSAVLDAVTKAMDSGGAKGRGARLAFNSATGFAGNVVSQAAIDDGNVDWKQAGQFAVGMSIIGEGMDRFAPARGVPGRTADTAGVDALSAIDEARPRSAIQAALTTPVHDHSPGDPLAAHSDTATQAGIPGTPGPADATSAHLASLAPVAGTPRADVPADRAASGVAPAPHAPDAGPSVSVVTGPHADAPFAADPAADEPAALPADAAAVPAGHADTGSAGNVPARQLTDLAAPRAEVTTTPARPEHGSGDPAAGQPAAEGGRQPVNRIDQLLNRPGHAPAENPLSRATTRPADTLPSDGAPPSADGRPASGPPHAAAGQHLADVAAPPRADVPGAADSGRAGAAESHTSPATQQREADSSGLAGPAAGGLVDPRTGDAAARAPAGHGAVTDRPQAHDAAAARATARDRPAPGHGAAPPGDHRVAPAPGRPARPVQIDASHPDLPRDANLTVRYGQPASLTGDDIPVFHGDPVPEQVVQGRLGDCRMLAGMRAVARTRPDAIRRAITLNDDGSVTVRLHETTLMPVKGSPWDFVAAPTGRIIEAHMDPDLPVFRDDPGRPAYANVRRGEALWPGLLEKGIASADKTWSADRIGLYKTQIGEKYAPESGYARLNRGSEAKQGAELLTQLTGEPARSTLYSIFSHSDPQAGFARAAKQLVSEGKPVIVGTNPDDPQAPRPVATHYNLIRGHAYELVDVNEGPEGLENGDGWVVLKNPWGKRHPDPIPVSELFDHLNPIITSTDASAVHDQLPDVHSVDHSQRASAAHAVTAGHPAGTDRGADATAHDPGAAAAGRPRLEEFAHGGEQPGVMVVRAGAGPQPFDARDGVPVTRMDSRDAAVTVRQWQRLRLEGRPVTVATLPDGMRGVSGEGMRATSHLASDRAYDLVGVHEGARGLENGDGWVTLHKTGAPSDDPVRLHVSRVHDELNATALTTADAVPRSDSAPPVAAGHDTVSREGAAAVAARHPGHDPGLSDHALHEAAAAARPPDAHGQRPREFDGSRPDMSADQRARFKFGEPRSWFGKEIPLYNGKIDPEQPKQGMLGDCGMVATIRSVARTDPDAINSSLFENPDGSITLRIHDTKLSIDGVSTPTGSLTDVRMTPELPIIRSDPARPAFMNVRRGDALWPGYLEKGIAGIDKSWTPERIAYHEEQFAKWGPHDRGYARMGRGTFADQRSELLSQLTGKPAHTIEARTPEEAAATWKRLLDEGKPVLGATRSERADPRAYDLVSGHVYEVVKVEPGPAGIEDGHVILKNPWGSHHPDPIPVRDLFKHLDRTVSTLGVPEYLRHMEISADHLELPAGDRGKYAFAEPTSVYGEKIPVFNGRPDPEQASQGGLGDSDVIVAARAVARTRPELIEGALTEHADGTITVRIHEAWLKDRNNVVPTGRVFEARMSPDLPVDPGSGRPAYANVRRGGAAWPGYLEKGLAGADKTWSSQRVAQDARDYPGNPRTGYDRLERSAQAGSGPQARAELLTQITGLPARVIHTHTVPETVQAWKDLVAEGKPVIVRASSNRKDPSAYDLVSGQTYEVTGFRDDHIILSSPWGRHDPEPVPVSDLGKQFFSTAVTVDLPPRAGQPATAVVASGDSGTRR